MDENDNKFQKVSNISLMKFGLSKKKPKKDLIREHIDILKQKHREEKKKQEKKDEL